MPTLTSPKYAPVGALVHCGYWREQYRVLSHNDDGTVTVRWETGPSKGETRTHRTSIDWKRDKILGDPEIIKCSECWDTGACEQHAGRKVHCGQCAGTGMFITRIENGVPKGPGGRCYRCNGKGYHTEADRKRNHGYERHGRRIYS